MEAFHNGVVGLRCHTRLEKYGMRKLSPKFFAKKSTLCQWVNSSTNYQVSESYAHRIELEFWIDMISSPSMMHSCSRV